MSEPLIPSFCSTRPTDSPVDGLSTMNAVMPLCRDPGSDWANATTTSADTPLVMKFFVPLRRQPDPSRFAVICRPAASEPDAGSVSAKQPSVSPQARGRSHRSCWAFVPKWRIGSHASELCDCMITPVEAHARLISSEARM